MRNQKVIDYAKLAVLTTKSITKDKLKSIAILILLWVVIHVISYFHFGISNPIDTEYYIKNANALLKDSPLHHRAWWYVSYISICALAIKLGMFPYLNIVIQLLFSLFSLIGIYLLATKLSGKNTIGFITGLLTLIWIKFPQWDFILYTDSLFASSVILSILSLTFKRNIWKLSAIPIIIFTIFIRPTGVGFILALLITSYLHLKISKQIKLLLMIPLVVGIGLVSNFILGDFIHSFIENYQKGIIIYPEITYDIGQSIMYSPDPESPPLVQLIEFFTYNWEYTMKSFLIKSGLFLLHTKPYYSIHHNLYILLILLPCYLLVVRSIVTLPNSKLKTFAITFILMQTITIGLTSENWDGRFLLPVLPWVFMLAPTSFSNYLSKKITH